MTNNKIQPLYALLIAIIALIVATIALVTSKEAKTLALSKINVEERTSLITPVYDQQTNKWSYLAVYELGITNESGPDVTLTRIGKDTQGSGFLVPLKGQEVANQDLKPVAFMVDPTISEIKSDPKLLKRIGQKDMGQSAELDLNIPSGATKSVRIGVSMQAYDDSGNPLAQVVLLSFRLHFSNGKTSLFRRGFPIQPIKTQQPIPEKNQ